MTKLAWTAAQIQIRNGTAQRVVGLSQARTTKDISKNEKMTGLGTMKLIRASVLRMRTNAVAGTLRDTRYATTPIATRVTVLTTRIMKGTKARPVRFSAQAYSSSTSQLCVSQDSPIMVKENGSVVRTLL